MSQRKKEINDLAGSPAGALPGQLRPEPLLGQGDQLARQGRACSSRWSARSRSTASTRGSGTATPIPGRSGNGFKLDDEKLSYPFYEKSKQAGAEDLQRPQGLRLAVAHAGPPGQPGGRREGGARPSRLHLHHLPLGAQARPERAGVRRTSNQFDPTTGDFAWHDVLMEIKERNPKMNNVYCEIGSALRQPGDRSTR